MNKKLSIKYIIIILFLWLPLISGAVTVNDFLDLNYTNPTTKKIMKYRLFVPKQYDKTKLYPLVGFLHGAGEGDVNNTKQLTANDGCFHWADDSIQKKYPSFVLAPNIAGNDGPWATKGWENGSFNQDNYAISESLVNYINIIKELKLKYSIDSNRIYSTGLSMGGGGTWASITRFPKMFAAAIPICGYGDPTKMPLVKNIPIWTFHGAKDGIITVQATRDLVAALRAIGGKIKYTELPDVGHFIWDYAYRTKTLGLADWLFAQKRENITANDKPKLINLEMIVYPNPSKGELNIILPSNNYKEVSVLDITGRVVLTQTIKVNDVGVERLDLSGLQKGMYIISAKGETTLRKKVVIE